MSAYIADSAALTHTADRIRAKTGGFDPITWDAAKGFGDAVDAIPAEASEVTHMTFTPAENSQSIELPFTNVIATGLITAYCANIHGTSDISRIKQFYAMKLALNTNYVGRIDVINADGAADYWTAAKITMDGTTIKLETTRPCYFAAGETYVIQITEVAM